MSVRKWPVVGVIMAVLWLFVRGVEPPLGHVVGEFLIGLAVGLPVAYAVRRLYAPQTELWRNVRAAPYAALYVAAFVRQLLVANLDVAYRVLAPGMPIEPAVIEFPLRVRTDAAVTTIANSITLTPGTLTLDHDADRDALYVHAIAGRDRESVVEPIRQWEDYALVIFDEELQPGDPVPGPDRARADGGRAEGRAGGDRTDHTDARTDDRSGASADGDDAGRQEPESGGEPRGR